MLKWWFRVKGYLEKYYRSLLGCDKKYKIIYKK